jgi:Flp pilus assembly protein TadD
MALVVAVAGCPRRVPLPPPVVAEPVRPAPVTELPADARAAHLEASVAERRQDFSRAELAYEWVTRLDPTSGWPWVHLGAFLERRGRGDEALHAYEEALLRAPDLAPAHAALGAALVRAGRPAEARDPLTAAAAAGLPDARHKLVRVLLLLGDTAAADVALDAWLAEPVEPSFALERARLAWERGRSAAAADDLLRAAPWGTAPAAAGEILLDAATDSCRLGSLFLWSYDIDLYGREGLWRDLAQRVAVATRDPQGYAATGGAGPTLAALREHAGLEPGAARPALLPPPPCPVVDVPAGCDGLSAAIRRWEGDPTSPGSLGALESRGQACGDAGARARSVAARTRRLLAREPG